MSLASMAGRWCCAFMPTPALRAGGIARSGWLAEIYGVETKVFNQAVSRNSDRFPDDLMFQLSDDEWGIFRSQIVTSRSHGGRRYSPRVFTEQRVAMPSSVLQSKRAVHVNFPS